MRHCHLLAQLTNESDEIIQSFTKRIQPQKLCVAKQKLAIECGDCKGVVPLPTQTKQRFTVTILRLLTSLTARCQRWGEGFHEGHTPPGKHYRVRDRALESALFFPTEKQVPFSKAERIARCDKRLGEGTLLESQDDCGNRLSTATSIWKGSGLVLELLGQED